MRHVSKEYYPTGYDEDKSSFDHITNPTNFVGKGSNNSSYTQVNLTKGSKAETFFWIDFDFSDIPKSAKNIAVTGTAKIYGSGNASYVRIKQIRAYLGTRTKGYSSTIKASTTPFDLDFGSGEWDWSELDQLQLRCYFQRGTSSTSSNYYARIYGITLNVEYDVDDIRIKENGEWVDVQCLYRKENGVWVPQLDASSVFNTDTKYVHQTV